MAKAIKRVGVIFLAVAIICLMAIGVILGVSNAKNDTTSANNNLSADSDNISTTNELPIAGTKELSGTTCAAQATIWDQVISLAKANPTKAVKVKMTKNWVAQTHESFKYAFGTSSNFEHGAIFIPANTNIIFDLNGCLVNRNMTERASSGQVFYVNGNLTIEDSSYDEQDLLDKYEFEKHNETDFIISKIKAQFANMGKITGGAGSQTGGGIFVATGGSFTLNSGMIADNKYAPSGGGVHAQDNCVVNINGGIIMSNNATIGNGGGIQLLRGCTLNLNGGIIIGNDAFRHGGGIYAEASDVVVRNAIIHGNKTGNQGAAICVYGGNIDIYDCLITKNHSNVDGGGVYVHAIISGNTVTNEANLNMYGGLITENSSGYGAGVYLYRSSGLFDGGTISNNSADGHSAGVCLYVNANCVINNVQIVGNILHRNRTDNNDAGGAGIGMGQNSTLTINGGLIAENKIDSNTASIPQCGGGISVIPAGFISASTINLNGGEITRNYALDNGGGIYDYEGRLELNIKGDAKVHGNFANGKSSDIYLKNGKTINIEGNLTKYNLPKLGVDLAEDYENACFTTGFGTTNTNGVNKPSEYFFSNNGAKLAILDGGEALFEGTISSDKYDFVYLEDGYRKNYKDNNLTHAVNDFEKSKLVNDGKLIIGKIESGTLINDFVSNINFDSSKLKIYNANGECVFDKGNLIGSSGAKVGTGWKLETYATSGALIETFYLSVLGDLTGDGNVNTLDITFMRRIAKGYVDFDSLKVEFKLAALITNKGGVINADADILWDSMGGFDLSKYY